MIYLGIDPGLSGGICELRLVPARPLCPPIWEAVELHPMPTTEWELWQLFAGWKDGVTARAIIEWIHPAIQGIGKSPMSKLYGNYMACRMGLTAAGISFEDVKPLRWQTTLGIERRKKTENTRQWKDRLRARAQQLFPTLSVWKEETLAVQRSVCDALLIAEYCRRVRSEVVAM